MSSRRVSRLSWLFLCLGLVFLYAPMIMLIIYSFNESRLVTVWAGFSTKWYVALFDNRQMMEAAWRSLQIAFYTATAATVLGTAAAMVLVRFRRFRGRTLFSGMVTAPLVMPEVITGLSLLLLFVSLDAWIGGRGMHTIWIAHVTFAMAFVTVVISSRLQEMDVSLEEAAMDLGANRCRTFLTVTLPIISPSLLAGWLLAFTLSLDDLVIASFVAGPSSTTLPMVVFSSVRLGVSPEVNALASLLIMTVLLLATVGWWLAWRGERKQRGETEAARSGF